MPSPLPDRRRPIAELLLTIASVAFLVWTAHSTVSSAIHTPGQEREFTFEALPHRAKNPLSQDSKVDVFAVLADGRLVLWDETTLEGNWQRIRAYPIDRYRYDHNRDSGSLRLRAREVAFFSPRHPWAGKARLVAEGLEPLEVDLYGPDKAELIMVGAPPAPPAWWLTGLLLVVCVAAAAAFGPHRRNASGAAWITFHYGFLGACVVLTQPLGLNNDSTGYLTSVPYWLEGRQTYFPVGYPFLLWLIELVPIGPLGQRITTVQFAMLIVGMIWLYRMIQPSVSRPTALLAVLATGSFTSTLFMPQTIMSETLTTVGMIGSLYATLRARETGAYRWAMLAGVLAAAAGLARVVPLVVILPAAMCLLLAPWTRRRLALAGTVVGITTLLVGGVMFRTWLGSGHFALSYSAGAHVYNRVVWGQGLLAADQPYTRALLDVCGDEVDPRKLTHQRMSKLLRERGIRHAMSIDVMGKVAQEAIRAYPLDYLRHNIEQSWEQYHTPPELDRWGRPPARAPHAATPTPLGTDVSSLNWRLRLGKLEGQAWPYFCWLALAGAVIAVVRRRHTGPKVVVWTIGATLFGNALGEAVFARYSVVTQALVGVLAAIAIATALALLAWPFTRQRTATPRTESTNDSTTA